MRVWDVSEKERQRALALAADPAVSEQHLLRAPLHDQQVWAAVAARPDLTRAVRRQLTKIAVAGPGAMRGEDGTAGRWPENWARTVLSATWLTSDKLGKIAGELGRRTTSPVALQFLLGHPATSLDHILAYLIALAGNPWSSMPCFDRSLSVIEADADVVRRSFASAVRIVFGNRLPMCDQLVELGDAGLVRDVSVQGWRVVAGLASAGSSMSLVDAVRTCGEACGDDVAPPVRHFTGPPQCWPVEAIELAGDVRTRDAQLLALPLGHLDVWAAVASRGTVSGVVRRALFNEVRRRRCCDFDGPPQDRAGGMVLAAVAVCEPSWYTPTRLNQVAAIVAGQMFGHAPVVQLRVLSVLAAHPNSSAVTAVKFLGSSPQNGQGCRDWLRACGKPSWEALAAVLDAVDAGQADPLGRPAWHWDVRHALARRLAALSDGDQATVLRALLTARVEMSEVVDAVLAAGAQRAA